MRPAHGGSNAPNGFSYCVFRHFQDLTNVTRLTSFTALLRARAITPLVLALAALPPLAHAELWAYVDSRGVTHFSDARKDEHYQLFQKNAMVVKPGALRNGRGTAEPINLNALESQAAYGARPGSSLNGARYAAVPVSSASLTAFNAAPHYKNVRQHLSQAAKTHQVDVDLLKAMMATESGFNAGAVSPKGAVGLMQIMPATAERYGLSGDATLTVSDKLADPKTNIGIGARYMAYLIKLFPGQIDLAVAAYNAGEGAVQRAGNRVPNYPETQKYVARVLGLYDGLKTASLTKNTKVAKAGALAASPASDASRVRVRLGDVDTKPQALARGRANLPGASVQVAARSDVINLNAAP